MDYEEIGGISKLLNEETHMMMTVGDLWPENNTMFFDNGNNYTNMSSEEIYEALYKNFTIMQDKLKKILNNKALDDSTILCLIIAYTVLIILGATGNGLVCLAVIRKPQMRTARNVFIVNLAISDLLLCLFTMPFSLLEITSKFWSLGQTTCKLVAGLQATSVFVSTISITAIALDRYKVIVRPKPAPCRPLKALLTVTFIWTTSLILSGPLFLFRIVESHNINVYLHKSLDYCIEKWPMQHGRAIYSIGTMIVQYLLPILIVTIAYIRILQRLKYRMLQKISGTTLKDKQRRDQAKNHRTKMLLISISFIFGISWLPLNIVNIVADLYFPLFNNTQEYRVLFALCHLVGMSSACSNPLLYGFFNDNFRKEFKDIFSRCFPCRLCCPKFCVSICGAPPPLEPTTDTIALETLGRTQVN